ncbi:tetratricopeptide repeat protein [Prevotella aurantiaca]|uniref:Tetratricopeptide repeat protein n=1 Tax=Prevotella aurantiaca TaxID=596085 RepID=A0A930N045_9BACT|nr:tetratricopeptide repeat protein [Prevotella aurantiaca]MBF1384776.1 tetratricopeptide repeat protein [Prevotella aurantiaca]
MFRSLVISILTLITLPSFAQYNIKKLMEEGRHSLDNGYYILSIEIFQRIVALKPNLYEAWYLMALSKYHLEDYKGADDDCQKALQLQPYIADIYDLYGMVCIREGDYDNAFKAYTKALEIDQNNQEYCFNRAYCLYMTDRNNEALSYLLLITKRWPKFSAAQKLIEEVKSGRKPKEKSIRSAKNDSWKINSLTNSSLLMQKVDKANTHQQSKAIKMKLN